jgi:uncharacterized protein (DUF1697 family)
MSGVRYLTLLRGINVGGKNLVRMADLRAAFEGMGFEEVVTYIQSGNVLFRAPRQRREELAKRIESELSGALGIPLKVVLLTERDLRKVVADAPEGFGAETHRCDVIFLRKPLTVSKALMVVETRDGVDQVWTGPGVLYFSRLAAQATKSRMSKIVGTPEYAEMTIRSWNTTTKLLALLDAS